MSETQVTEKPAEQPVEKKARKERKDKGVKRGPRTVKTAPTVN